jgi:hypothetical protein
MSGLEKGLAALGQGMETYAKIRLGRDGQTAFDEAVEANVNSQLRNLDSARQSAKDLYAQFDTEDAKRAAGEIARYEDAQRQLEVWTAGAKDQATKAAGQAQQEHIAQQILDRKTALYNATRKMGAGAGGSGAVDNTGPVAWLMGKGFTPEEIQKKSAELDQATGRKGVGATLLARSHGMGATGAQPAGNTSGVEIPKVGTYSPAAGGFARSEKDADALTKTATMRDQYVGALTKLKALRQESYGNRVNPSAIKEAEQLVAKAAGLIKGPQGQDLGAALSGS